MPPGINEGINKPKIPPTLNKTKKLSIKPPLNNKFAMFVSIPRPNPITNENAPQAPRTRSGIAKIIFNLVGFNKFMY